MKKEWKELSFKEKVKKVSKYAMNILAIINGLLIKLSPVWNWHIDKIIETISIIIGAIGVWLVGGKIFETPKVDDLETQEKPFKDIKED